MWKWIKNFFSNKIIKKKEEPVDFSKLSKGDLK